ncbi:hypothetical protein BISA_1641 [Bifidobacterium saguini DSM 23967]|uniref:Uncharacterized protein n=2 Tax=Bifidobacterium saguini TaxID=762210 RepID=A0A087DE69_9BIFI|nr:hypothetical protein BISA_1641 [Bifidobacterium saguini DSM 23967]
MFSTEQMQAQYTSRHRKHHHDCNEIRQSACDVTTMLLELADWTIADADVNAQSRKRSEHIMQDVQVMALGRYTKLNDLATYCWNEANGSGYDYDLANPFAWDIYHFMQDAENTQTASDFYEAAAYCAVAFLMMRADSFTVADLANLCSPEVFIPITDIGEPDETNEFHGRYGYDIIRKDQCPKSRQISFSRVLGLIDKLPSDLRGCGSNELGDNEYDEQYYSNRPKPDNLDWHTIFDSKKYDNYYATLSTYYVHHNDDSWPMGGYFTPKTTASFLTDLPATVDFALDVELCDLQIAFPGTDQLIPFMTDLDRLRRYIWKNHRTAEYGGNVDFDRIMQALSGFRRRTWARTTHTLLGGNHD